MPVVSVLKNKKILEFVRFAAVGVIATGIHYGIYLLLKGIIPLNAAYTAGYVISFCFNFVLTNFFTFKTQPNMRRGLGFIASHAVNYGLHIVLFNLFLYLSVPENYAPIPVYMIAIPVNFLLIRFVFRSDWARGKNEEYEEN
jgi:putative flippase GtrA